MKTRLKSIIWKEGRYYTAQCLDVDVASFGTTERSALANLKEALELYFEDSDKSIVNSAPRPVIREVAL